jgi:hypothetical protein
MGTSVPIRSFSLDGIAAFASTGTFAAVEAAEMAKEKLMMIASIDLMCCRRTAP